MMIIKKIIVAVMATMLMSVAVKAVEVKGTIKDSATGEPLVGAAVMQVTSQSEGENVYGAGVVTDIDGNFSIELREGSHTIEFSYIAYKPKVIELNVTKGMQPLAITLDPETEQLASGGVSAVRDTESERVLQRDRIASNIAIENMGAKEMSTKGLSNVGESVKKITGVSLASAGQLVVRGLGDRYSITTLNGLPIASPNPDNKLIPLEIFPSSSVKNVTVSKVYDVASYADYSGAHINIETKDNAEEDFFTVDFKTGGYFNTIGQDFYRMDHVSLFSQSSVDPKAGSVPMVAFGDYAKTHDIFDTGFSVKRIKAMPDLGGTLSAGKSFRIGNQRLSLLGAANMSSGNHSSYDSEFKVLDATGKINDDYTYDSYETFLDMTFLASASMTLREQDKVEYTFFYARNAKDTYSRKDGHDYESHNLTGSNDVTHIYGLMTHQLSGKHYFGERWSAGWQGSYSSTSSDEPDRRQVMYLNKDDGTVTLFKLNQQETMRYFGVLDEDEFNADVHAQYDFGVGSRVAAGLSYKDKTRNYAGTRYYYGLDNVNINITDIYDTSDWLSFKDIANGTVTISRNRQPRDSYDAGNRIFSGYVFTDWNITGALMLNAGVRMEKSSQWVDYTNDQSIAERRTISKADFFPALNLKWSLAKEQLLRFSLSRTITRPSFIEMAPFLYQESYGSVQLRGNENLGNSYNYNFDLRYELIDNDGGLLSFTGYFKYLDKPIERVQMLSGGAAVHTFRNAEQGLAAGVEAEFRKALTRTLKLNVNASYMYTDVKLPEGGAYTNKERALQGASPYLVNADLTWQPKECLSFALLYNLQGPRIHAVGISGLGDVRQRPVHMLDFNAVYKIGKITELKLHLTDILGRAQVFEQSVPYSGDKIVVEKFRPGTGFEIGVGLNF